jgi:hypothetical protein
MRSVRVLAPSGLLLAMAVFLAACGPLIANYSLEAYKNATTLKAETLALVRKSAEPFSSHREEVEALSTRIDAAYEFSAGTPNNQISAAQWSIMRDPDRNMFGGFVEFWRAHGSVSPAFRDEYLGQIAAGFDYIICLEANKERHRPCRDLAEALQ